MGLTKHQIQQYRDDIVKFAEDLYYLGPNKYIKLWGYQKKILREATERDKNKRGFKYDWSRVY